MVKISALSPFTVAKNHPRGFCRFLQKESFSQIVSASSNGDCSAQDRSRELKLVSLEPPENFDSEYVFKIIPACLWTRRQRKTSDQFLKCLCEEKGICYADILLMSQINVGTFGTQPVVISLADCTEFTVHGNSAKGSYQPILDMEINKSQARKCLNISRL